MESKLSGSSGVAPSSTSRESVLGFSLPGGGGIKRASVDGFPLCVEEILFGVHSAVFPFGLNLSGR